MIGFEDAVRGFDMDMVTEDNIDQLDIYAEFLGEEYLKMKESFQKAITTMSELFILENERARMSAPIQYEDLIQRYDSSIIERAAAVHETYIVQGGKSRDKYMQRLALEFKSDPSIEKADLDLIDGYLEHKRWYRQKSKALYRDWERDKRELKERTVKMIETEVEETKERLMRELELYRIESKKERKHMHLEEKRKEYEEKMKIINEIEADKRRHEEEERRQKEFL